MCTEIETVHVLKSVDVCGKCTSKNDYLMLSFHPFIGGKAYDVDDASHM